MEWWILAILVLAAFLAAFVDSIVGGGGVISLPALLAVDYPVHLALGTNKLAATGASSMAAVRWTQGGHIVLPLALALIPFAGVGSFLGAVTVLFFQAEFVRTLVITVMVVMTIYVLVRKKFGREDRFTGIRLWPFAAAAGLSLAIGFYDGFLGPGTGSLLLFMFLGVTRFDFLRAAGHGRILNFASNLAALALFAIRGHVDYAVGFPMMLSMMAGAYVGSHFGMRHGTKWIKPLFVAMTSVILLRLVVF
ncbi:MAG: TSUP family transporter [Euryarchaeota archaeon]|nr:TSUP family transporter [Euryarchaeota archaeon]